MFFSQNCINRCNCLGQNGSLDTTICQIELCHISMSYASYDIWHKMTNVTKRNDISQCCPFWHKVSLAHNVSFWQQWQTHNVTLLGSCFLIFCQFLGPKTGKFCKFLFLTVSSRFLAKRKRKIDSNILSLEFVQVSN